MSVDMDAVEQLSRLDDAPGRSRAQRHQRVTAGAIDARKPQDCSVAARYVRPGPLGSDPHTGAVEDGLRRRALVDPSAAVIAIHADGREIDDFAPARRQHVAERGDGGIASAAGRDRYEKDVGVADTFDRLARGAVAGKGMHLDAGGVISLRGIAHGGGDM
ncbi:hypothetical protein ACVWWG_001108 [Bradyrhizobium sp. LB7.2]